MYLEPRKTAASFNPERKEKKEERMNGLYIGKAMDMKIHRSGRCSVIREIQKHGIGNSIQIKQESGQKNRETKMYLKKRESGSFNGMKSRL